MHTITVCRLRRRIDPLCVLYILFFVGAILPFQYSPSLTLLHHLCEFYVRILFMYKLNIQLKLILNCNR